MWNVEYSISGIKNKATFKRYQDALEYLEGIVKSYGKEYMLQIKMWESE